MRLSTAFPGPAELPPRSTTVSPAVLHRRIGISLGLRATMPRMVVDPATGSGADIHLIAVDLDHTLLTEAGDLPPGFDDHLRRLGDAGIVFVPASGRPLVTLKAMFPPSDRSIGYISDNGGLVSLGDDVLYMSLLPRESYRGMAALTAERTTGVPIICGVESAHVASEHRQHEGYLSRFYAKLAFVDRLADVDVDADKFTVYFPDGDSRSHYDRIYAPIYGDDYSVTVGGPVWVDVMNKGVNKGNALRILADHLGLFPEQMMAFGDTDNDLEMLDAMHHSYAVANADQTVRDRARFTTESNDEYGVVTVIRRLLDG